MPDCSEASAPNGSIPALRSLPASGPNGAGPGRQQKPRHSTARRVAEVTAEEVYWH